MKVAVLSVALLFSILLCPPAQAKALLEGTQDDLRELDLDNVAVLETPLVGTTSSAGVRPSPCLATPAQAIPVGPSTAQCSPADSPDNALPQGCYPGKPLPRAPAAFPSLSPQEPLDEPGHSPCPSCASWPGALCFWAGAQQLLHPIAPAAPSPRPPLLSPASQTHSVSLMLPLFPVHSALSVETGVLFSGAAGPTCPMTR
ncbi:vegetative cell wall protein gp1-like [Motacilla alba alba]|uniref:vegetative cell wall protein gp1-like n=1 Tax=Motacilla alba alba TaxID=1094192 RepID=UPI0018D568EC|nr:vegetative cell wall protein gp1-like [Motacilla alba alba]